MANHKSAAKKARRDEVRNLRNKSWRSRLRTGMKTFRSLVDSGKREDAAALLCSTLGMIDSTAKAGVIKDNTADRYKSRLQKAFNKMQA